MNASPDEELKPDMESEQWENQDFKMSNISMVPYRRKQPRNILRLRIPRMFIWRTQAENHKDTERRD